MSWRYYRKIIKIEISQINFLLCSSNTMHFVLKQIHVDISVCLKDNMGREVHEINVSWRQNYEKYIPILENL